MTSRSLSGMPDLYLSLPEDQQRGKAYITVGLPSYEWKNTEGGVKSTARTADVPADEVNRDSPPNRRQPKWHMIKTWEQLVKQGFSVASEIPTIQPHSLALLFPHMSGDEFTQLVADIKTHGLREPIVMYEGAVLDGWHRYQACQRAGVEPKFREFEGDDPLSYVISMNVMRRHLSAGQRALLVVQACESRLAPQGGDHKSNHQNEGLVKSQDIALAAKVSPTTVDRARSVLADPELAKDVIAGLLSLDKACKRIADKSAPKAEPTVAPQPKEDKPLTRSIEVEFSEAEYRSICAAAKHYEILDVPGFVRMAALDKVKYHEYWDAHSVQKVAA